MKARKLGLLQAGALMASAFLLFHAGNDLAFAAMQIRSKPDETAWLRLEFGADGSQAARLAAMQAAYRMRSRQSAEAVEVASRRLASGLDRSGALTRETREDLARLEAARARSHELALEHCVEIARILGPMEGPRYLQEMERVLLGLAPRHHSALAWSGMTRPFAHAPEAHGHRP